MTEKSNSESRDSDDQKICVGHQDFNKSCAEVVVDLINELGDVSGFENTISGILRLVYNTIGGDEYLLCYKIGNDFFLSNSSATRKQFDIEKNSAIRKVFETHTHLVEGEKSQRKQTPNKPKFYSGIYPLLAGTEVVGVISLKHVDTEKLNLLNHLPTFFNYAALLLKKEITEFAKLQESETRFRTLVEKANDIIYTASPTGVITYVSPKWEELLGHKPEEVLGKSFDVFIHPEDLDICYNALRQATKNRENILGVEYRVRHKEGSYQWYISNASPIIDEEGNLTSFQGIAHEITGRKQTEQMLRQSEEKYRTLIQNIKAAVVVHGPDTKIKTYNATALKLLGLNDEQMFGKMAVDPAWHFFQEDGSEIPHEDYPVNRVLRTKSPVNNLIAEIHRPNNSENIWVLANADPVFDNNNTIREIVVTFVDITGSKKAEERLVRMNRELRAISSCNQALLRVNDEQTLLDQICRVICEEADYRFAWVGYAENDDSKSIRPVAFSGYNSGYLEQAGLTWADSELGNGPAGKAIRGGESVYFQDLASNPQFAPWRDHALERGFRSETALPLKDENSNTFGVMVIYSGEVNAFIPEEIRLLEELAGDLAFGITVVRSRAELKRLEHERELLFVQAKMERDQAAARAAELDAVFSSMTEGVNIYDNQGNVIRSNNSAASIFAQSSIQQSTPLEERTAKFRAIDENGQLIGKKHTPVWRALHGETVNNMILVIENLQTGQVKWLSDSAAPVMDSKGRQLGAVLTFHDITEEKLAEKALLESEERYRMVFENSPVSIWEEDFSEVKKLFVSLKKGGVENFEMYVSQHPEFVQKCVEKTRIVDVNQAALNLHSASGKKELIDGLANIFTSESYDTFRQELVCLWNGGTEMTADAVVKTLTGDLRYVVVYFVVSPGYEESLSRVIVSVTDITDRKKTEEALKIGEERYRLAQSISHVGNWEYNIQTTDFWGSDEAKRIYGFDPAQGNFTTEEVENCIPEREQVHQALVDLVEQGKPYNLKFEINPLNSSESKTIESVAELELDDHGNPLKVIGVIHDVTQREKAQKALNDSARRLNEAQRLAHIGNWELDLEKDSLSWSVEIYRMFELDPKEFGATYEAFLEAIHPDDREVVNSAYTKSLKSKTPYSIDHRLLFPDGRIKYVHEQCETFYEKDTPVRSIGTVQDITERKLAEIKIRSSEQLFRALVENSPDFIARYSPEFRRVYVNPAIQRLFGNSEKEVMGKTPADSSPIYAPQQYILHLKQVIDTAAECTVEIPFRTERGEMHWGHIRFVPELDQEGKVASILAIGRDIHEIKENENRFRMLAENFPDFVVRFNSDYRNIYINSAAKKAFGITDETFNGKSIKELPLRGKSDQNDADTELIRRAFIEGEINDSEVRWNTQEGERVFELRNVPEKDAAGKVVSVLGIARDITERKQAEEELARYREHLEELVQERTAELEAANTKAQQYLDIAGVIMVALDVEGRVTLINQKGCEVLGIETEDIIGKYWVKNFVPKNVRPRVSKTFSHLMKGEIESVGYFENPIITCAGENRLIAWHNVLLQDDSGKILGTLSSGEDITERRNVEEALRKSEERMRLFFEHKLVGTAITSIQKGWIQVNDKLCQMLGYSRDELKQMTWAEITHPEDLEPDIIQFERLLKGEIEGYTLEKRFICKDGHIINTNMAVGCVRKSDRSVDYLLAFLEDITQRKRIEQTLRKSEFLLKKAQELSKIGGWDWNVATKESTWTDQVYLVHEIPFGVALEDRVAKSLLCYREEDRPLIFTKFQDCINKGIAYDIELPFKGHKGTKKWIRTGAIPHFEGDKVVHVYGYIMDITELKRTEDQIRKLNHELRERAVSLESANKELEAFAYSVSHDLRAPLRHVEGFMELLDANISSKLDAQSQHYFDAISNSAKRMGSMIDDLLSFSRMSRNEMSTMKVDLMQLVNEVVDELKPELKGRGINWKISELPVVKGDRSMLRMVFVNLISNAIKFTQYREVADIEIGFSKKRNETTVFVRDNGVGFDQDYAGKLFGVFQRLHSFDEFEGTGIGLANVRRIIDRHGGKTWAEGVPDQGATFFFSLPKEI